jgi:hypothetical protein
MNSVSRFDELRGSSGVGYSFSANWINILKGTRGTSFAYISNITSPDRSTDNVNWYDYHYPNTVNNSANSVYYNTTVAFFELPNEIYAHGFVAQFAFSDSPAGDDDSAAPGSDDSSGSAEGLSEAGVIGVAVAGSLVGVAVLGYLAYLGAAGKFGATGGGSSAASGAAASSGTSGTVNPMSGAEMSGHF